MSVSKASTVHSQAVMREVHKIFHDKPEQILLLSEYQIKMNTRFFAQWYLDLVVQRFNTPCYDIYDAYSFALIHDMIFRGYILMGQVESGCLPKSDKNTRGNNKALLCLPSPFWGTFSGKAGDFDGVLGWDKPIILGQLDINGNTMERDYQPDTVRLEVGYTESSRTLLHLLESPGLARWPYGSDVIHIFKSSNNKPLMRC